MKSYPLQAAIQNTLPAPRSALPACASTFVLKIAERCNLNCSYCYMYNKGDDSFVGRPKFMSQEIAAAALERICSYGRRHETDDIVVALHGGEPLLAGRDWIAWFLEEAGRRSRASGVPLMLALQTNGTLLDAEWAQLLARHDVLLGVSCDGTPELHDETRRDFLGRGSYAQVRRAIELLVRLEYPRWGVLCVANPSVRGSAVLKHFADLGVRKIDFLWPDYHHDAPPPWTAGTLAAYYRELFDYWFDQLPSPPRIRWFETAIALMLGRGWGFDGLGPHPVADVMVESDGTWEPLDTLRICANGITRTGLDVRTHEVEALLSVPLYQAGLCNQEMLPAVCRSCRFGQVCAGGYLPHRYGRNNGFANPSVHCGELYSVLSHIRARVEADFRQAGAAAHGAAQEGACSTA
jgi:uncharacterized protein